MVERPVGCPGRCRGIVEHQLGVARAGRSHLHGRSHFGGNLFGRHAHGAEQMPVVHLHGYAAGRDKEIVVRVGTHGVGGLNVADAVRFIHVEIIQGQHLRSILAVYRIAEVIVHIRHIHTNLRAGQGIEKALATGGTVIAHRRNRIASRHQHGGSS